MWLTAEKAHSHWRSAKSMFRNAYQHGKRIAGTIDGYASVGRRILSAAAPMLEDMGAGGAVTQGVKALNQYDTTRKQVMDTHEKSKGHFDRIAEAANM
jgi:hypothetical protein